MSNFLTKVIGDKKEWKNMEARAGALPRDHRIVYGEIKQYMRRSTSGDGLDMVASLQDVLGLFETSTHERKHALDVTGEVGPAGRQG